MSALQPWRHRAPFGPSGPPPHFFTLTFADLSNSRGTSAYQDTLGNGTSMLLLQPGVTRQEPNGFLRENAATNVLSQSQYIGGGAWSNSSVSPVLNSSDVLAPDGTQTATKVSYAGNTDEYINQAIGGTGRTCSVWVRTLTGTATIYILDAGAAVHTQCSVTATWTRFVLRNAGTTLYIGGFNSGGIPIPSACTVYLWGAQAETAAFPTSYVPSGTQTVNSSSTVGTVDGNNLTTTFGQADVFGGLTGSLLTTVAGIGQARCYWGGGSSATTTDPSVSQCYVKPSLSTAHYLTIGDASQGDYYGTFDITTSPPTFVAGASTNITSHSITAAPDGWYLCSLVSTFGTTSSIFWTVFVGELVPAIGSPATAGGYTCVMCCPQVSAGTIAPPYFATDGSGAGVRDTDHITFANPLHGLDPASWSFGGVLTPIDTWANVFNAASTFPLWFQGGVQTTPNSWRHIVPCVGVTSAELDVYDHLGGTASLVNTNVVSGSTPVTTACFSKVGVISMTPGTPGTPSFTNDTMVQPVTITLGFSSDPFNFQGWMKTVWMDPT